MARKTESLSEQTPLVESANPELVDPAGPAADPVDQARTDRRAARDTQRERGKGEGNMLPARGRRVLGVERLLVRLIATVGVIGVGVILGAILVANHTQGWIVGLVIGIVTVVLSAVLWSSRQL